MTWLDQSNPSSLQLPTLLELSEADSSQVAFPEALASLALSTTPNRSFFLLFFVRVQVKRAAWEKRFLENLVVFLLKSAGYQREGDRPMAIRVSIAKENNEGQ